MCVCVCVCVCVRMCVCVCVMCACLLILAPSLFHHFFPGCIDSLYSKMTMEVILSTAFGRSVDVQGGKGGEIYDDARAVFNSFTGKQSMLLRIIQFITSENVQSIVLRIIHVFGGCW